METLSILPASAQDYGGIVAIYSSSIESLPASCYPGEASRDRFLSGLGESIEAKRLWLGKSRKGYVSFAIVSHGVGDYFYPRSHSYAKSADLLEGFGYAEEGITIVEALHVDYAKQRRHNGLETLKAICGRYPKHTILAAIKEDNRAAKGLFQRCGFLPLSGDYGIELPGGPYLIYVKKYKKSGLCREANW